MCVLVSPCIIFCLCVLRELLVSPFPLVFTLFTRISCILQRSNAQMLLSRAVHQEPSCPAHAHRARASCLPDSNPYGRDGLAHSRSLSTARLALRVA